MNKKTLIKNINKLIETIGIQKLSNKIFDSSNEYRYCRELYNTARNLVFHINGSKTYKITINEKSTKIDLIPVYNELNQFI